MVIAGAICFGAVVGWVTYRTLRRKEGAVLLSDISSVIAAVGGAAIVGLFQKEAFGAYGIGLAAGFFLYFIIAVIVTKKDPKSTPVSTWMGD
jgi:zinc transporter ZupT